MIVFAPANSTTVHDITASAAEGRAAGAADGRDGLPARWDPVHARLAGTSAGQAYIEAYCRAYAGLFRSE